MHEFLKGQDVCLEQFLHTGFDLKQHLAEFLDKTFDEIDSLLPKGSEHLSTLHPAPLKPDEASSFYEDKVGAAHLVELAAWHLDSSDYIADTIRLQQTFARGQVLDFGGGIGTHAIAAASLPEVEHVWFVDLNPINRSFVQFRAEILNLGDSISVHRDLISTGDVSFETLVCLDVLEHIPDPSSQLLAFLNRLSPESIALFNWYFFKGFNNEYPFHFDDSTMIEKFFMTLQNNFIEVFHPFLITTRAYKPKPISN